MVQVYLREAVPACDVPVLLSLILYKVVDPSKAVRDDALQMLETLSLREWAGEGTGGAGRYRAAVVGSLPDSYQQYQYQLSARLAQDHPDLSELLCVEMMQRQLDAVDIIAQHQVRPRRNRDVLEGFVDPPLCFHKTVVPCISEVPSLMCG